MTSSSKLWPIGSYVNFQIVLLIMCLTADLHIGILAIESEGGVTIGVLELQAVVGILTIEQ
jgi:hypothetical protein